MTDREHTKMMELLAEEIVLAQAITGLVEEIHDMTIILEKTEKCLQLLADPLINLEDQEMVSQEVYSLQQQLSLANMRESVEKLAGLREKLSGVKGSLRDLREQKLAGGQEKILNSI